MARCLPWLIVLVACGSSSRGTQDQTPVQSDAPITIDAPDLAAIDAVGDGDSPADATSVVPADATIDAPADAGYLGSDAGTPGVVSCYSEGAPTATCTLPSHCCFTNYSAHHNGSCTSAACGWGTIDCDGPEDCAGGQRCCAHALKDATNALVGYTLSCQQAPCGATPLNEELCHPTTTSTGTCSAGTCVTTFGANNDLPRSLYICR